MATPLDFLFVFPKFSNGRSFEGFDYHLGAAYVRAFLESNGALTEQFVHPGDAPLLAVADAIIDKQPRAVGFSCYDINYYFIKLLAESIKARAPQIKIICGGPTATFSSETIMADCSAIDLCVRSYGEITSLELLQWIREHRPLHTILGITYRSERNVFPTPDRPIRDTIPSPTSINTKDRRDSACTGSLDIFPDPYLRGLIPPSRATDIGIVTSRGCTFPCIFCNFSAMSRRRVHFHSCDRVLEVLQFINDSAAPPVGDRLLVSINDDNFSIKPVRIQELLERIADKPFRNLKFWAEMRAESLQANSFALLKRAGFAEINFGLESGVPHVLNKMKKVRSSDGLHDNYRAERQFLAGITWAVSAANNAGLDTSVSVILGSPGESRADGQATLDFVRNLGVTRYAHNFISVLNGTELSRSYALYGMRVAPSPGKALPLWTFPPYDVYSLPVLEHDQIWLPDKGIEMLHVFRLLTGTMEAKLGVVLKHRLKGTTNTSDFLASDLEAQPIPVISIAAAGLTTPVMEWMRRALPMAASVWVVTPNQDSRSEAQEQLAKASVPIQEVNMLRANGPSRRSFSSDGVAVAEKYRGTVASFTWRVNEFSLTTPTVNTRTVTSMRLADIDLLSLPSSVSGSRKALLARIDRQEDILSFENLLETGAVTGTWHFSADAIDARLSLADGCRWSSRVCPAKEGGRWLVDDSGGIRPCSEGPVLGYPPTGLDALRERAASALNRVQDERHCESCEVRSVCSSCMLPLPVSPDQFCAIRRRWPDMGAVVEGLVLARALRHAKVLHQEAGGCSIKTLRQVITGALDGPQGAVPLMECVLLEFDNQEGGFLYHARSTLLATLGVHQLQVFELLRSAGNADVQTIARPNGRHPAIDTSI